MCPERVIARDLVAPQSRWLPAPSTARELRWCITNRFGAEAYVPAVTQSQSKPTHDCYQY